MGFKDLREWLDKLESEGDLKRIKAQVDWEKEIGAVTNMAWRKGFSGLLFENIKDYQTARCRRLFTGALVTHRQIAMMFGLPKDTHFRDLVNACRQRTKGSMGPVIVPSGQVKENIVKGEDINLYDFPVPLWNRLDGGRYINTCCGVVTKDPETGAHNVGLYRGMIADKNRISLTIVPSQHIGQHFAKYREMGKEMPVAMVYGWERFLDILFLPTSMPRYMPTFRVPSSGSLVTTPQKVLIYLPPSSLFQRGTGSSYRSTASPLTTFSFTGP